MPDLSIIIVNYNVKEFILNLLDSIDKCSPEISREIIIVDNDSDDGSVEAISELRPDVKLIANKENVGFGKANNQGMEIAEGKYFLLLNPDTIVKEDTFSSVIKKLEENSEIGMAGCKVLNPNGTLQLACRRSFPGPWTSFTKVSGLSRMFPKSKLFAKYNLTYLDENQSYEVDAISGCFMMIKKEVYEKIGGFDPVFFMYGEDLDLCYRVQKSGYKVFYFHDTEIIHYKGESTKRSSIDETKIFYSAMNLFVKKHLSSSILVSIILQFAIFFRKILAFLNVYKLITFSILIDFPIFILSVILAENIYSKPEWPGFPEYTIPFVYIIPALLQIIVSIFSGVYKRNSMSVLRSTISLFFGFLILTSLTFFFKQYAFSRFVALFTYVIAGVSFIGWRIIFKLVFKIGLNFSSDKKRTLIVGTNENGLNIANKLRTSLQSLYEVVGFIGENRRVIGESHGEFKVIGSVENIKKVVQENKIEKVIFSAGQLSFDKMFNIVSSLQDDNIEFQVAGSNQDFLVGKSNVTMLENIPLLNLNYNISKFTHKSMKRLFDLVLSGVICLTYPLLFLFVLLINKNEFKKILKKIPSVFVGKKSFVGPEFIDTNSELFLGKPGITGIWFLDDSGNLEKEREKLDIYYAKNQNIWMDIEILGRTFSKILFEKR